MKPDASLFAAPRSTGISRYLPHVKIFVLAVFVLAVAVPQAHAAKTIGGFIGGQSNASPLLGGLFGQPRDVTVYTGADADPTNDKIFTVEGLAFPGADNSRVQRFDANGDFERAWGQDVDATNPSTGFEICTVAADCKAGTITGTGPGEFNQASGIAVDQANGWVYVFDRVNDRVQKFDLDGNFILMFGLDVNATTAGTGFEICTQASGNTCKAGIPGTVGGAINGSAGGVPKLEVAQATGELFVADRSNRWVSQFQSDGSFVRAWGWDVDKATVDNRFEICTTNCGAAATAVPATSNGAFAASNPANVAVDSQNVVYATDAASGVVAQRIVRFDADLAPGSAGDASAALLSPIEPTTGSTNNVLRAGLSSTGVPNGIEIDPDSDGAGSDEETLLATRDPATPTSAATIVQELDIPTQGGETPADAVTVVDTHTFDAQAVNGGIGVQSQTGNVYLPVSLAAANFPACGLLIPGCVAGAGLIILNSGGGAAATTALTPTVVSTTTATLTGTVTANGRAFYRFEVAKGGGAFTQVGPTRSVSGSGPVAVSLAATGLSPNTLYRTRIVVSKISSLTTIAIVNSNEPLFLTDSAPPDATTLAASGITSSGALLAGRVDPNGSETTYQFHYGLTDSYGNVAPASPQLIGSADGDQIVSQQIANLLPQKTYHYQICATNPEGDQCGTDRTFTTKTVPGGGTLERAYELVSPADKVSGAGVGSWYNGPGTAGNAGFAAHTGERFAAHGYVGSVLLDSAFSYGNDWAFAQRTPSGWISHSPITRGGYGSQTYRLVGAVAASDDLSQTVWNSTGILRPFPEMESWPELGQVSFVSDWDGRWEVIAPTDPAQVPTTMGAVTVAQAAASRQVAISTGGLRGLLGPSDPTSVAWGDLVAGSNVYLDDLSAGVSDTFPGTGVRALVNVCTGTGGVDRTEIPSRTAGGEQGSQECPGAAAGRSARLISERGGALPFQALDNGISANGSRVFFLSPDPGVGGTGQDSCDTAASGETTKCPAQLYVRQRDADGSVVTRWISRTEVADQDASLMAPVVFEGSSEDGDKVFFRTAAPLTVDDPNGAGPPPVGGVTTGTPSSASWDLYMYDLPDGLNADPAGGDLTRVSGGPDGNGDCNVPDGDAGTGSLRFVSSDGGRAYFTCAGTLPGVGASSNGTLTEPSGNAATTSTANLYLYDGSWRFVTQLPRQGGERIGACATVGGGSGGGTLAVVNSTSSGIAVRGDNCVHGTSDGAFVTFWTAGRLTADDPDAVSADFYGFDADADELTRITAAQGGPGGSYTCNNGLDPVNGPLQCFGDGGFAGGTGAVTNRVEAPLNVVEDPVVSGDRIALFQSKSRLVAGDSDDAYDVYQWRNGELSLVSTGASARDGAFLKGSDSSGTNVYFATRDRLSWQDVDSVLDIYTARVGGGIPEPPVPPICAVLVGDGCQGTGAAAPVAVDVGSSSSGGGNEAAGERMSISVASPSARARAGAARSGVLALRVRVSEPGVVSVSARAGKKRGAATTRVRGSKAGVVTVRLRLSRVVRTRLARGRAVRLAVTVTSPGAHKRTLTTTLKRGSR
jgi:hypothetical protein